MLLLVPQTLKHIVKQVVPPAVYRPILAWYRRPRPVRWGNLRRLTPLSQVFGLDRGQPIDRYYIEEFLQNHVDDIHGRVLEIGDRGYTRKFGGNRVTRSDVLHAVPGNKQANLVGDLTTGENIPQDAFNCLILTQLFNVVYDVEAAITNCYRALKNNGVLLATFPGITQISRYDMDRWGDYWRFTSLSARRLFEEVFSAGHFFMAWDWGS
jgi:SAM-dependent methyltransferase